MCYCEADVSSRCNNTWGQNEDSGTVKEENTGLHSRDEASGGVVTRVEDIIIQQRKTLLKKLIIIMCSCRPILLSGNAKFI